MIVPVVQTRRSGGLNRLFWPPGVCVPCMGGLPECFGVPAVGLHPSGRRLHPALRHRHPDLPLHTLPSCLQGVQTLSAVSSCHRSNVQTRRGNKDM